MTSETITMASLSSSFLGLVKCTRMDLSEGKTYMTSICYPLQACFPKIIGVLTNNGGGKRNQFLVVSAVCRSWTWHSSAFMLDWGHPIPSFFASMGLGNMFWPLICSFPHHHHLRSLEVKCCQIQSRVTDMFKRSFVSLVFNLPLILCWYWFIIIYSFVLCRWCGKNYGPP